MNLRGAFWLAGITTFLGFLLLFAVSRFVLRKQIRLSTMALWSVCIAYLVALLYLTLNRVTGEGHVVQWNLVSALWDIIRRRDFRSPGFNILLFVPWGILGALLFPSSAGKAVFTGIGLSLCIECIQYFLQRGIADILDIVCNGIGAAFGVGILLLLRKIRIRLRQNQEPTQTHV